MKYRIAKETACEQLIAFRERVAGVRIQRAGQSVRHKANHVILRQPVSDTIAQAAKRRAMMARYEHQQEWVDEDREMNWQPARGPLEEWGYFSVEKAIFRGQVWRFITFQFLHASLPHLLFNMFALYMFGMLVEQYLGRRRFLAFYLISGVGGAVMYLILMYLGMDAAAAVERCRERRPGALYNKVFADYLLSGLVRAP